MINNLINLLIKSKINQCRKMINEYRLILVNEMIDILLVDID